MSEVHFRLNVLLNEYFRGKGGEKKKEEEGKKLTLHARSFCCMRT